MNTLHSKTKTFDYAEYQSNPKWVEISEHIENWFDVIEGKKEYFIPLGKYLYDLGLVDSSYTSHKDPKSVLEKFASSIAN